MNNNAEEEAFVKDYKGYINKRRNIFAEGLSIEAIEEIERFYELHLPCFQCENGHYSKTKAIIRDAQRELCLWLRHELKLSNEQQTTTK